MAGELRLQTFSVRRKERRQLFPPYAQRLTPSARDNRWAKLFELTLLSEIDRTNECLLAGGLDLRAGVRELLRCRLAKQSHCRNRHDGDQRHQQDVLNQRSSL